MNINIDLIKQNLHELQMRTKNQNKETNIANNNNDSVICLYNFFCINNIKICEKIMKLTNFINKYHIIIDYNPIIIGQIDEEILDYYNIIHTNNNEKYVLLQYNTMNYLDFDVFLFNLPTPKLFIFHALDSYAFLLNSLHHLNEIGVTFFNLSTKNIVFDKSYKPILINFETSMLSSNIDDFIQIIEKIEDYTYKPLEIHVVFYLIKNNENSLSYSSIDSICDNFVKNMSFLSFFSKTYKEKYYETSMEYLKKYINKPKLQIISEILLNSNTWDNYSLSILYLHIIGNIIRVFNLKDTLLNKIVILLSKNIVPNPFKRETLKNSIQHYEQLYHDVSYDWGYVNLLSSKKMDILHDYLLK
jgi:hypothetical protein